MHEGFEVPSSLIQHLLLCFSFYLGLFCHDYVCGITACFFLFMCLFISHVSFSDVSVAPFLGDLINAKYFLYAESSGGIRPTLNIFPSQPMHVEPSTKIWQLEEEEEENKEFHLEPSTKVWTWKKTMEEGGFFYWWVFQIVGRWDGSKTALLFAGNY